MAAKAIYQGMIVPILTYCGLMYMHLCQSREDKLLHGISLRALDIVRFNTNYECDDIKSPSVITRMKACQLVRNCLDGISAPIFKNF
jgi:hypothetical protein